MEYIFILPSCWFSLSTIDQYSPLLYYSFWDFFRPSVVDRPLSHDFRYIELTICYYSLETISNILKRYYPISLFYTMYI